MTAKTFADGPVTLVEAGRDIETIGRSQGR
jgi:hypothetical protein